MKSLFFVGGPLIACIGFGFWSGLLDFVEQNTGLEHTAGAQPGGTFMIEREETYQCDESGANCALVEEKTEFSEVEGLGELEVDRIEYREGDEITTVRKLNGLNKYANITIKRPSGFNWKNLKFTFEENDTVTDSARRTDTKFAPQLDENPDAGVEMIEIDPPVLTIPAN